ncbi:MAG: hypothetical protein V3T65_06935 [Acidobacteriota bacterium]
MIKALVEDGGELQAWVAPGASGSPNVLKIGHAVQVAEGSEENLARWPTLEEIYSAMDFLMELGAVVTLALVRGQDREGPLKLLTLTQIGKIIPTIDGKPQ